MVFDHKHSILDFIDDPDMSMDEVKDIMTLFIDAYVRRFDAYPVDAVKTLNHSLELNQIPQKDINNLCRLTSDYGYKYGFLIRFGKTKNTAKWTIFQDGRQIEGNSLIYGNQTD